MEHNPPTTAERALEAGYSAQKDTKALERRIEELEKQVRDLTIVVGALLRDAAQD